MLKTTPELEFAVNAVRQASLLVKQVPGRDGIFCTDKR